MTAWQHRERGSISDEKLPAAVNILPDLAEQNRQAFGLLYLDLRQQLAEIRLQQGADAALEAIAALLPAQALRESGQAVSASMMPRIACDTPTRPTGTCSWETMTGPVMFTDILRHANKHGLGVRSAMT